MTVFLSMLKTALYACLVQNLIFSGAYGMSETVRMAKRPKHFFMTTLSVTAFSVVLGVVSCLFDSIGIFENLPLSFRFFFYVLILTFLYFITAFVFKTVFSADKKFLNSLGMCAVNTLVLAVPLLNHKAAHSLSDAAGTGLGTGLAFAISMILINGGMKFIHQNRTIPEFFKGTPALFIYTALLALTISCISGESLFI
jgi:electron transport complex protein RnfA